MTVQELIEKLNEVGDKNAPVLICDTKCRTRKIARCVILKNWVALDVPFSIPYKDSEQLL